MRKVLSIVAVAMLTLGFISCESESAADQEQLYIDANDNDVNNVERNSNDNDVDSVERG